MPSLAPLFSVEASPSDPAATSLRTDGGRNRHCFGAWRQQVQCGRLQAQIAVLQGEKRAAVAQGNEARANRLQTRISALQTRFSNECV